MRTASQKLTHEHKAILVALDVVERMCKHAQMDKEVDADDILNILDFFNVFVNDCHHHKEEHYLFPALEEVGVKKQDGLIGVILDEHQKEREFIRQMQESVKDSLLSKQAFVDAALGYAALLRNHIAKEHSVLFQIGDIKFTESTQRRLLLEFESVEKNIIGPGKKDEFVASIKAYRKKYA